MKYIKQTAISIYVCMDRLIVALLMRMKWLIYRQTVVNSGVRMAIDPVCKMKVDETRARYRSTHEGKEYYFCSPGCKTHFDSEPGKYIRA